MGKQVSLDDFGPAVEDESSSSERSKQTSEELLSSLVSQLSDIVSGDNVSVLLSYKEGNLDERDAADFIYVKPSQVESIIDALVDSREGDWIIIRDDNGKATSMIKNTPSLSIIRFVSLKK